MQNLTDLSPYVRVELSYVYDVKQYPAEYTFLSAHIPRKGEYVAMPGHGVRRVRGVEWSENCTQVLIILK